ncbi:MAG: hypothetical protein R3266_02300, partial [Gemmatimonadota bacterium]|nr:hypothetical protein [Gemmatimonadota bacterium]
SLTMTFDRGLALSDPDVVFGLLTWTVYAAALGGRARSGGFGPGLAGLSVLAFTVSAVAFLVLRTLSPSTEVFL